MNLLALPLPCLAKFQANWSVTLGNSGPARLALPCGYASQSRVSPRDLFLSWAAVLCHIAASRPSCAAKMGFWEIQVYVWTSDVMARVGCYAGPAPDVRHQPEGTVCSECLAQGLYTVYYPMISPKTSPWWHSGWTQRMVCIRSSVRILMSCIFINLLCSHTYWFVPVCLWFACVPTFNVKSWNCMYSVVIGTKHFHCSPYHAMVWNCYKRT